MSTYQRYLREKKEVKTQEQDLEEATAFDRWLAQKKKDDPYFKPERDIPAAMRKKGVSDYNTSKSIGIGGVGEKEKQASQARLDAATKARQDKQAEIARKKSVSAGKSTTSTPEDTSTDTTATKPVSATSTPEDTSTDTTATKPVSSGEISGNTLSSLLASAGIGSKNLVGVRAVRSALERALQSAGLEIDSSFLNG